MKHKMPRKPVLNEKKILGSLGYNPQSFLRAKKENKRYEFIEVSSSKVLKIENINGIWKEVA